MNRSLPVYRKHNSFVEIRAKSASAELLYPRIRRIRDDIERVERDACRREIVRAACDDLLLERESPDRPRLDLTTYVLDEMLRVQDEDLARYLYYRYRYDIFPKSFTLDDFPPCLQIEPTSVCNFRCVFCYQTDREFTDRANGHMGMMPLDLFKRIVDQAEGRCEALTLASRGEPLISPDIVPMLRYCKGKFLALKVNTNAWFLDEGKSHEILEAGVNTVVFSADAAEEPLYSRLRVGGSLDRVVANVRRFKEIRERYYPDSKIIARVSGVSLTEEQNLDDMEAFWGELVDQVAFVKYNPWENVYASPANELETPCSDLWRRMFVWFDGRVNPCDVDFRSALAVGNVRETALSELWRSEQYERLRATHVLRQRAQVSPCNRCTVV